jgi:hypothetical protein
MLSDIRSKVRRQVLSSGFRSAVEQGLDQLQHDPEVEGSLTLAIDLWPIPDIRHLEDYFNQRRRKMATSPGVRSDKVVPVGDTALQQVSELRTTQMN